MVRQAWWLCYECDHVIKAVKPPGKCPRCKKSDQLDDITRYVPEVPPQYSHTNIREPQNC
jgi:hypothetical protein